MLLDSEEDNEEDVGLAYEGLGTEDGEDGEGDEDEDEDRVNQSSSDNNTNSNYRRRASNALPMWLQAEFERCVQASASDKRNSDNRPPLYRDTETFYFPRPARFFILTRNQRVPTPAQLYDYCFFLWDPECLLPAGIPCPNCHTKLHRHGNCKRPRRYVDFEKTVWVIGYRYKCPTCLNPKSKKHTVTFQSWNERILAMLPKWLSSEFPAHLSHRSGLSRGVFMFMRTCFQHGFGAKQFANALRQILCNPRILKVGRNVAIDLKYLEQATASPANSFVGAIDLAKLAKERLVIKRATMGLADLCAATLGKRLNKNVSERVSTLWENEALSRAQIEYAALDAYASLRIYEQLISIPVPSPLPSDTVPTSGDPILLFGDDRSRLIARGRISEHYKPRSSYNNINITDLRCVIEVTDVYVPGAVISTHHKRSLESFGSAPFHLVFPLESFALDPKSKADGDEVFKAIAQMSWAPDMRSRVKKDAFHVFDMFYISTSHGLRVDFSRALRDAIFIPDSADQDRITTWASRQDPPLTWEYLVRTRPKWVWTHCKRMIPPPEQLYRLVELVFRTYGPLKDVKTGSPLFNTAAWSVSRNILELIRKGYLSDPPGFALYTQIGIDSKADGLPIYRCFRGTNFTEGGVHRHLVEHLPKHGVSVRHVHSCLQDFVLCHNLRVGTFNSTGKPWTGHYSIWLTNELHEMLLTLRSNNLISEIPAGIIPAGWINGNFYLPTTEVTGILPIPEKIRRDSGMLEYDANLHRTQTHWFVASLQGTQHSQQA
ncbi:hypothetical protein C8R42DRAFT_587212 [Lentinula raphanica]|nr:hypothetical protein C8R42DRAFT_587212 [Lentinula raphanica]